MVWGLDEASRQMANLARRFVGVLPTCGCQTGVKCEGFGLRRVLQDQSRFLLKQEPPILANQPPQAISRDHLLTSAEGPRLCGSF